MDKTHRKGIPIHDTEEDYSSFATPSTGKESYLRSSTEYAWMTNNIMLASVKPTSASLPSWDTWYPSSSTTNIEEDSDYFSATSASDAFPTVIDPITNQGSAATLQSFPTTDFDQDTISLRASTAPLPTSPLSITLTDNIIDESISPTATTDLETITTNTSTSTQTDFWSSIASDITDPHLSFNTYATPKLENTQNVLNAIDEAFLEVANSSTTKHNSENTATVMSPATTEDSERSSDITTSSATDSNARTASSIGNVPTMEVSPSWDYDQTSDAYTTTAKTLTNNCTSRRNKSMTDNKSATETTENIASRNYKLRNKNGAATSPSHSVKTYIFSDLEIKTRETTSSSLNSISSGYETNKNLIGTTSAVPYSSISSKLSKTLASGESLQHLNADRENQKLDIESLDVTASSALSTAALSTKSPVPSPFTTRKSLRKSTQRLLATPFHQLTYVRNKAGDIDIDNIDNISIYPDLLDNDNNEPLARPSTSRLTMISGYLPTSATATLPESIRIAKIKINRERKRMLRLRNIGNYT